MSNSVRRSARTRKANPKYTVEPRASPNSQDSDSGIDGPVAEADSEDESDFAAAAPSRTSPNELDLEDGDFSEDASSAIVPSADDEISADNSEAPNRPRIANIRRDREARSKTPLLPGRDKGKEWAQKQGLRSRHWDYHTERTKRGARQQYALLFGPSDEDLRTVLQTREIWGLMSRDITLPSRLSLYKEARLQNSRAANADSAQNRAVTSLDTIPTRQALSAGYSKDARHVAYGPSQDIVTGPWPGYQRSTLDAYQVVDAGEGYTDEQNKAQSKGWLLNAGARVQCLAWMPTTSDQQILTVVPTCTSEQRGPDPFQNNHRSPAFSASATYPSSIQFWRVPTVREASSRRGVGRPILAHIACVEWGDTKLIEYNRLKGVAVTDDAQEVADLIVLSSDGNVRVVPITVCREGETTTHEKIDKVALLARPAAETVFTTFSLATAEDLAIGASDGTVSLFSMRPHSNTSSTPSARPYLTIQVHPTYISSLAFATDLPQFLASQSAGGDLALIDIRTPHQDRVSCHKTCLPNRSLTYLPFTRAFLTTADSAGNSESYGTTISTLNSHNLRHFYFSNVLAKLPEASGVITVLATSTAHPCVLVANSQGQVFATNSVRRNLPDRNRKAYLHKIFEYDWQVKQQPQSEPPPAAASSDQTLPTDLYHHPDPRAGLSRLTRGFKPEPVELGPTSSKRTAPYEETAASAQVIFEEKQAVTAMAWNANLGAGYEYAGWATVAWGSGVVWVGDLGHDAK